MPPSPFDLLSNHFTPVPCLVLTALPYLHISPLPHSLLLNLIPHLNPSPHLASFSKLHLTFRSYICSSPSRLTLLGFPIIFFNLVCSIPPFLHSPPPHLILLPVYQNSFSPPYNTFKIISFLHILC